MGKKIAIGSDHGGYKLKEKIIDALVCMGFKVDDLGTASEEPCDYPEYGFKVARKVAQGKAYRGIVICKSGLGMSMIANKLPGVRAALCHSKEEAVSSREHNDANVLVFAAKKLRAGKAVEIINHWMDTSFLKGRHARRVKKIKSLESIVFKKLK
jgi:RpiB/LacA/LacB family sugar-phosphate isomerase